MKGAKSKGDDSKTDSRLKSKSAGASKKSKKAAKDPNKPKRPPSAFFVFMEQFREQFKKDNPNNKSVAAVGKAAGQKWKAMSDAEKAPYQAKADKKKQEFEVTIQAYNKKMAQGGDDSDKSKSEVHDEDEDGSEEDEEDD